MMMDGDTTGDTSSMALGSISDVVLITPEKQLPILSFNFVLLNLQCDKTLNKHAHVHGSEKRDLLFLLSRKVIGRPRSGLVKVPNRGHVHVC